MMPGRILWVFAGARTGRATLIGAVTPSAQYSRPASGYSGQGTRPPARVDVPAAGIDALRRQLELEPAGEVDGDQGRDVGDAVGGATDPGAFGQALVEEPEEVLHARPAALG